jgi:hypothetical protein
MGGKEPSGETFEQSIRPIRRLSDSRVVLSRSAFGQGQTNIHAAREQSLMRRMNAIASGDERTRTRARMADFAGLKAKRWDRPARKAPAMA